MNIFIYAGSFKSTTFINRLILGLSKTRNNIYVVGRDDIKYKERIPDVQYLNIGFSYKAMLNLLRCFIFLPIFRLFVIYLLIRRDRARFRIELTKIYIKKYQPDVIHFQWPPSEKLLNSIPDDVSIILSLRGRLIKSAPIAFSKIKEKYIRTFPKIDRFHAVCESITKFVGQFDISRDKCKVIYSGLNLDRYNYLPSRKNSRLNIISIGRSNWKKGFCFAFDACKILCEKSIDYNYTIVSDISEEMIYNINDLDLNNHVQLVGMKSHDDVIDIISQSDILLLPSVEEGVANVVIEAMALGTLVISTKCGGIGEIILDNSSGFLIPIRDPYSMAKKIIQVSELSSDKKKLIKDNARRIIEKKCSEKIMIQGMLELYNSIDNEKN